MANVTKSPETQLTIVLARILDNQRTFPLKPSCFLKGNPTQLDVPGVFRRIEFDLHSIIVATIILASIDFHLQSLPNQSLKPPPGKRGSIAHWTLVGAD
ncbi:MAG: hypothetical protein AB9873_01740 [Syntrophobacteraceae bacterium]